MLGGRKGTPNTLNTKQGSIDAHIASERVCARTSVDRCATRRKRFKLLALLSLVTITYT